MSHNGRNSILWTATDFTIPKPVWNRMEDMGYKVVVTDGDEPLRRIQDLFPRLWIGQIDGKTDPDLTDLRDIRDKYPELPIILMSRRPNVEEAVKAIKLGATDYITETISPEGLEAVLEGALKYPATRHALGPGDPKAVDDPPHLIAVHPSMEKILNLASRIAPSRSTVLIRGETGTGKEVLARFVHNTSDRKAGPFIAVNCAALPENLLESELFGHERGAFTGAISRKKGKFQLANGGTLLLDEISEMDVSLQAKLLRVLQEREIDMVGGQVSIPVDVRVIATTNRDLEAETKNGNFRLDLFYRLNVVPLHLPPLRSRRDDIVPLSRFFLKKQCTLNNMHAKRLSQDAEDFLLRRNWHGNVRELENLIERAILLVESELIRAEDLKTISSPEEQEETLEDGNGPLVPLREMEKKLIFQALDGHNGNRTHAAKVLGISVRTLRNKLHEYRDEWETERTSFDKKQGISSKY